MEKSIKNQYLWYLLRPLLSVDNRLLIPEGFREVGLVFAVWVWRQLCAGWHSLSSRLVCEALGWAESFVVMLWGS